MPGIFPESYANFKVLSNGVIKKTSARLDAQLMEERNNNETLLRKRKNRERAGEN